MRGLSLSVARKATPGRCSVCGEALAWMKMGRPPKFCERCRLGRRRAQHLADKRRQTGSSYARMRHDDVVDTILEVLAQ